MLESRRGIRLEYLLQSRLGGVNDRITKENTISSVYAGYTVHTALNPAANHRTITAVDPIRPGRGTLQGIVGQLVRESIPVMQERPEDEEWAPYRRACLKFDTLGNLSRNPRGIIGDTYQS